MERCDLLKLTRYDRPNLWTLEAYQLGGRLSVVEGVENWNSAGVVQVMAMPWNPWVLAVCYWCVRTGTYQSHVTCVSLPKLMTSDLIHTNSLRLTKVGISPH